MGILRASDAGASVTSLRCLRFLRIIRLARMTRAVQALGQNRKWGFEMLLVLECIWHSLPPLVTMMFVWLILSLLLAMAFSQTIVASLAGRQEPLPDMDLARMYGSLWDTYFTLFTAITGGAEWRQLLVPLETLSWMPRCAFTLLVTFMKYGALNIVTAVLIVYVLRHRDSLLQREAFINQARSQQTFHELREVFRSSNKEYSGRVTAKSCVKVPEGQGAKHLATLGLTVAKAMGLFRMMDQDAHHRKDVDEFLFLLAHSQGDTALMLAAMLRCETSRIMHRLDKMFKLGETRFAQVLQEDPAVISGRLHTA